MLPPPILNRVKIWAYSNISVDKIFKRKENEYVINIFVFVSSPVRQF